MSSYDECMGALEESDAEIAKLKKQIQVLQAVMKIKCPECGFEDIEATSRVIMTREERVDGDWKTTNESIGYTGTCPKCFKRIAWDKNLTGVVR